MIQNLSVYLRVFKNVCNLLNEGIRMTVNYNITNKKTGDIVIDAYTKHCFTDRTLRPINMKKKNIEIYNIFEKLYEENEN